MLFPQILLYGWVQFKGDYYRWDFIGKIVSHHSKVVGLNFGLSPSGQVRLFSADSQGFVGDYDVEHSTYAEGVQLLNHTQVPGPAEASAGALCFAPPMPYFINSSSTTLLLMADDMYKLRLFDTEEKATCATYIGPTFGQPVQKMLVFKNNAHQDRFLIAYSTGTQVSCEHSACYSCPHHAWSMLGYLLSRPKLARFLGGRQPSGGTSAISYLCTSPSHKHRAATRRSLGCWTGPSPATPTA